MCKIFVFLFNYFVALVVSTNLSKFLCRALYDNFDNDLFRSLDMYKLIVLVIILLLVFFFPEPEKLKVVLTSTPR